MVDKRIEQDPQKGAEEAIMELNRDQRWRH